MKLPNFALKIKKLLDKDSRYTLKAYLFVNECLAFAIEAAEEKRHISGFELLHAMKFLALEKYGNMARMVLENWGIYSSEDVGEIVFNLVEENILARQDDDERSDFYNAMNFERVFDEAEVIW